MMLETMKYVRKPFHIDAVQVTPENMAQVALWTGGEIRASGSVTYVKVKVHRAANERQTKAYVGDWVLYAGTSFKVYTPKAFAASFEQVGVETTFHNLAQPAPTVVTEVEEKVVVEEKPKPRAPRKPVEKVEPDSVGGHVLP